ncbi:DNA polymerase type B [Bradyrhizobium shewense]|uniref:DNA-directed DNA polymerase n=1 Tax=Bradyrhizobium shewense TaxID=1761772 RepID=A0A1C3XNN6_9BRAD|nr:DNA polymerase [Bradyrhizobium shewense]SCB53829.1 DNA polymerase type B [Bradyrhizobium shewense]
MSGLVRKRKKKPERELAADSIIDPNQLEMFEIEAVKKASKKGETFLEAASEVTIREMPYQPLATFEIDRSDIEVGHANNYLLIGFDTEYQPLKPVFDNRDVEAGKALYEVLSYQFHAIQLNGSSWNGMAIPNPNQRLTFTEFLTYALAAGAERGEPIPSVIVLVGHYNRADIPAFADRGQVFDRVKNVRNSLVTQAVPISVKMSFKDQLGPVEFKVYLRDTMLLAPAGRKSLASLGELVGIPKMMLHETREGDLRLKRQMKFVRANKPALFREYALLDARISAQYFREVTRVYQEATGAKFVPSQLSKIGLRILQDEWNSRTPVVDPVAMVGRETQREVVWNNKTAQFNTKSYHPYIEEIYWWADFVTECYQGGRNEQLWFGPTFEDDWSDYDLKSAYPTGMATIGRPNWKELYYTDDVSQFTIDTFGFACVDFRFPAETRYPTLPVRSDNGIIFPLAGRSYCAAPEIQLAINLGCDLRIRQGVVIPQDLSDPVFLPFIKESIARRNHAISPIEKEFWKEVTNSCYGKTAQGLRKKRVFDLRTGETEKIGPSAITNPFFAAHITSFVRAAVGEIMNALPADKMVFSVTTDGLNTNATEEEMAVAKRGPIMRHYERTVVALTGKDEVLTEKHSVRQLLGMRTRGQATIKPGNGEQETRYVLAKAGVRPPMEYREIHEQNDYMLKLFFGRTPETMIDIEVHTTMADMIKHGADLVSKQSRKRASLEYDFKRCPKAIAMATAVLPNLSKAEHVAFSTKPWRDISEFKMVRAMWEDYWRSGSGVCLKTIDVFADFAEFFEMMKSLPGGSKKYFRKHDRHGLQRLRRDLCRAYKHGMAGFPKVASYTASEFADILNSTSMAKLGVKTKIADVENGKRAPFSPNSTPPTKEVLAVCRELRAHFPELDQKSLVGSIAPDQVMLSPALTAKCPFVERLVMHQEPVGP